jgi:hypothetical protein
LIPRLTDVGPMSAQTLNIRADDVARDLRLEYQYNRKDASCRTLDKMQPILAQLIEPRLDLQRFLDDIADMINKQFRIREVTIGLRSPTDGLYRYVAMAGLRADAWKAHSILEYSLRDFTDPSIFKGRPISTRTVVFLAEDKPYLEGEEETFNRRILLESKRKSVNDCIEGDYLNVHIFNDRNELVGWIEISGDREEKFPDPVTIKWIEHMGLIIGIALAMNKS